MSAGDISYEAQKISVILFKVGALLSMIGSFLILRDAWHRFREKKDISLTTSLVCELSLCDFFSSFFGPFLGTWMVPKETGAFLAAGTTASCTAQGFLANTFYSASVLCNTSLATAYCLIIKKGWKDDRSGNTHNWLLLGLPLISFSFSVGPLFDKGYNFGGVASCDIISYPLGCNYYDSDVECTRGQNTIYFMIFELSALLISNLLIMASIFMLIHSVWVMERRMDAYSTDGQANRNNTLKTTWQGIWYIAAFALAWWPFAIKHLIKMSSSHPPDFLQYIHAISFPAQGAFNAVVYFRPKYKLDREKNKRDTTFASLRRVFRISEFRLFLISISVEEVDYDPSSTSSQGGSENIPQRESLLS